MLVFYADIITKKLEVDLVALQSEAVYYGDLVCNATLLFLDLEVVKQGLGWNHNGRRSVCIGYRCESDGEASNIIYIKLGY